MNRPSRNLTLAALAMGAAMLVAAPAYAQGTQEQQDACAPDAFKFCQKTIPDIPKTTACMQEHFSQLSKRCKLAFGDATGGGAKAPANADGEAAPAPAAAAPATAAAPEPSPDNEYTAQIRSYCRQGLIDPYTCHNTLGLLGGGQ